MHLLVDELYLIFEYFGFSYSLRESNVYLLEDVQLAFLLKDGVFKLVEPVVLLGVLLVQLVEVVLVVDHLVFHWLYQLFHDLTSPPLDVVP